jgi:adenine-specific DNA-methyltransferase
MHKTVAMGRLNASSATEVTSGALVSLVASNQPVPIAADYVIVADDSLRRLRELPEVPLFDLVVTSPPYNIGKSYEKRQGLQDYLDWQESIIEEVVKRLKPNGSVCWQVGNYVDSGEIFPLDVEFIPMFRRRGLKLRNRIIWQFGHGLHNSRRFSGRYEVVLWFTKGDDYQFNLDDVRVASKYPSKRHYKGPHKGQLSGNPKGKNPEDVWSIPNVKGNHIEKTDHPCQFPVGLVERLVLALTGEGDLVFDPFAGVSSAGVAAAVHGRRYWGVELDEGYAATGVKRVSDALNGRAQYRPHDRPLYDPSSSSLSRVPQEWTEGLHLGDATP